MTQRAETRETVAYLLRMFGAVSAVLTAMVVAEVLLMSEGQVSGRRLIVTAAVVIGVAATVVTAAIWLVAGRRGPRYRGR